VRRIYDRWWLVGTALALAVLAVSWSVYRVQRAHQRSQEAAAQHQASAMLADSVHGVLGQELVLARVVGATTTPIGSRWPTFASIVTDQNVATSAGLIVPVSERDRASFERATGLHLTEPRSPGKVQPAAHRALHLVLTQYAQKGGGRTPLGLDLGANPLRRSLLLRAASTGTQVASPPVEFLMGGRNRYGVVVYAPIRDPGGSVKGWITTSYGAADLVTMVTSHLPGVHLTIEDGRHVLVGGARRPQGLPSHLAVAGRIWSIWAAVPSTASFVVAWLVLGFGLCLTLAVSLILRQANTRALHAAGALAARDAEEAALRRIATLVAEQGAPEDVFTLVAEQVGRLLGARTAAVSRFEPDLGQGVIVGGWTPEGHDLIGSSFALDGVTASAAVFRTGRAARTLGYGQGLRNQVTALVSTMRGSGGIAAPIVVGGRLWGALGAAYRDDVIPVGAEARLERFAQLVSIAISNADAWDRLARQASTDALTGLANRREFDERLASEMARAHRHGRRLSLALFDLDHFKRVNDSHGHQAGDDVLVRFARLLAISAREGELVARIGGEEFAWVMPETDEEGAYAAAERAREAIAREVFPGVGALTVSVGVRSLEDGDTTEELIRDADRALYWAKKSGRNAVLSHSGAPVGVADARVRAGA
jgi:diguanylate cyclase (GGDEF)-like protein